MGIGRVSEYQIASAAYGRTRRIWVYTPPTYTARESTAQSLLLAFDGGEYLTDIPLPTVLDSLFAAKRIPPTIAVLVDDSTRASRIADLGNQQRFAKFIGDELMPWVRQRWKVTHDPHHTIITGSSAGGLASAFLAFQRPDLFGNVLSQSGAFWRGAEGTDGAPFEWLTTQFASSSKRDISFFMDVGSTENRGAINGTAPSILDANRRLRDVLKAKGYDVTYTEVAGGVHAPQTWLPRLPIGIAMLADKSSRR